MSDAIFSFKSLVAAFSDILFYIETSKRISELYTNTYTYM